MKNKSHSNYYYDDSNYFRYMSKLNVICLHKFQVLNLIRRKEPNIKIEHIEFQTDIYEQEG